MDNEYGAAGGSAVNLARQSRSTRLDPAPAPAHSTQLSEAIGRASHNAATSRDLAQQLRDRLNPFLQPPPPRATRGEGTNAVDRPARAPFTEAIDSIGDTNAVTNDILASILQDLTI